MIVPDSKVHEIILKAIDEIRLLKFVFRGKERIVEPHDYGIFQGRIRLFSYQIGGESTEPLPNWRWMDVPQISDVQILDQRFDGSRGDSSQKHHQWDRIFARVGKKKGVTRLERDC